MPKVDQIIESLTHRVRLLSLKQIAREWYGDDHKLACQDVALLEEKSLVAVRPVLAKPLSGLISPVLVWNVGDALPDFGKAAYRLRSRWREPAEPTKIVVATQEARRCFGGFCGNRWPRPAEISHDIGLAEVFLWYCRERPVEAARWVPEAELYSERLWMGEKLPDALIQTTGNPTRVVEFGGSYGKQKLMVFHAENCSLNYEIW